MRFQVAGKVVFTTPTHSGRRQLVGDFLAGGLRGAER